MKWLIRTGKTIAIIAVTAVISSMLTIGTTAIVVDRYIQSALDQFRIPIDREPLTAMNLWSMLLGKENTKAGHSSTSDSSSTDSLDEEGKVEASTDGQDDSLPVWGNVSNGSEEEGAGPDELVMTPEEWTKNKDQLPQDAKNEIFSTLMKKLPQEDWQRISVLMEDGLTSTELTEVEQILAKHLNDEEYKQMKEMLTGELGSSANNEGTNGGADHEDAGARDAGARDAVSRDSSSHRSNTSSVNEGRESAANEDPVDGAASEGTEP